MGENEALLTGKFNKINVNSRDETFMRNAIEQRSEI